MTVFLPRIKFKLLRKNQNFGKLVFTIVNLATTQYFSDEIGGDNNVVIFKKILYNEMFQHLKDVHNLGNHIF